MKKIEFGAKPKASRQLATADAWVEARKDAEEPPKHQASKPPMKRLTIDIDVSLHKKVKSQCALQDLDMAEVVRDLLEKRFGE
jgi:hypothetical protein